MLTKLLTREILTPSIQFCACHTDLCIKLLFNEIMLLLHYIYDMFDNCVSDFNWIVSLPNAWKPLGNWIEDWIIKVGFMSLNCLGSWIVKYSAPQI